VLTAPLLRRLVAFLERWTVSTTTSTLTSSTTMMAMAEVAGPTSPLRGREATVTVVAGGGDVSKGESDLSVSSASGRKRRRVTVATQKGLQRGARSLSNTRESLDGSATLPPSDALMEGDAAALADVSTLTSATTTASAFPASQSRSQSVASLNLSEFELANDVDGGDDGGDGDSDDGASTTTSTTAMSTTWRDGLLAVLRSSVLGTVACGLRALLPPGDDGDDADAVTTATATTATPAAALVLDAATFAVLRDLLPLLRRLAARCSPAASLLAMRSHTRRLLVRAHDVAGVAVGRSAVELASVLDAAAAAATSPQALLPWQPYAHIGSSGDGGGDAGSVDDDKGGNIGVVGGGVVAMPAFAAGVGIGGRLPQRLQTMRALNVFFGDDATVAQFAASETRVMEEGIPLVFETVVTSDKAIPCGVMADYYFEVTLDELPPTAAFRASVAGRSAAAAAAAVGSRVNVRAAAAGEGIGVGLRSHSAGDYFLSCDGDVWSTPRAPFRRRALKVGSYVDVKGGCNAITHTSPLSIISFLLALLPQLLLLPNTHSLTHSTHS
jgi:hypothetical protein